MKKELKKLINFRVGDRVRVNFNQSQHTLSYDAEIVSMPYTAGDYWVFLDTDNGQVHMTNEPLTLTKEAPKDPNLPF